MNVMDRFEDVLTQLAKDSSGDYKVSPHYAFMTGYLLTVLKDLAMCNPDVMEAVQRRLQYTEKSLFELNKTREVDSAT